MSALLNGLRGLPRNGFLPISSEISSDIQWWLHFLPRYNGVSIIPPLIYSPEVLITDACATGAGGYFGHRCFHLAFSASIMTDDDYNINVKELLAIITALRLWGSDLKGTRVLIQSDNLNAAQAISSQRSHSPLIQQCLHVVWFLCASFDLDLAAQHIPGHFNIIADLLSRWSKDAQAKSRFYTLPDADKFVFCDCSPDVFDLSLDILACNFELDV